MGVTSRGNPSITVNRHNLQLHSVGRVKRMASKVLVVRLKSVPRIPKSFSEVASRACVTLRIFDPFTSPSPIQFDKTHLRSRKFNKDMMVSNGSRCTSTLSAIFSSLVHATKHLAP